MGLLGTNAPLAADVNLIVQIIALSLLLVGFYFVRKRKLRRHSRLMKTAIIAQFGALIVWMGPSLILNIGAFASLGFGQLVTGLHAVGGAIALTLAIGAAFHRSLISRRLRHTMRATFIVWGFAAVLGIAFYVYYYLL